MNRVRKAAGLALAAVLAAQPVMAQGPGGVEQLLLPSPAPAPAPAQQPVQAQQAQPQASASRGPGKNRRDEAFEEALKQVNPFSPGQIRQFRSQDYDAKKAMLSPVNPGRPVSRALKVTLRPGEVPPSIRVQPGMVSTMTFSDITGQPWPVLSVVVGNPDAYVAQSAGEEGKTNIIVLSAKAEHVPSNVAVTLVNHPVPILLSVEQGQPETDFRVDVRVESRGPNAAQDIVGISSLAPTNDSTMIRFLDGTPPQGSRRLNTSSSDVEAWRYEDILYVRTRGELLSPAYTGRSNSVAGVNVYVLNDSPVVLVSNGGRTSQVRIMR